MLTFEDRTYDGKMHTFKELDYKSAWLTLTVICKRISPERLKLMNDSQEYQPSESGSEISQDQNKRKEEIKLPSQEKRLSKNSKKSSKYIKEMLSAHNSMEGKSDMQSSVRQNSVYIDNQTVTENEYAYT